MVTYEVDDVSPGHVVPGDARRAQRASSSLEGEEPVAFDHDCREGICGMCGLVINGDAARARGHHHLPAAHALASRTATTIDDRAVARRRLPGHQGPGRRPRRLRPDHPGRRLHLASTPARRPTRTPCPVPKRRRRPRLRRRRPASAAAPASRPARTARRCCSLGAKITHLGELPQGQPERDTRVVDMVDQHDARGLRRLHQHRRVHRGLPQGDPARRDLPAQRDLRTAMRHGRCASASSRLHVGALRASTRDSVVGRGPGQARDDRDHEVHDDQDGGTQ